MKKKDKHLSIAIFSILVVVLSCFIFVQSVVELQPGVGFGRHIYTSKDSIMIMNRHMGYINYDLFVKLVQENLPKDSQNVILTQSDSVYFKTKHTHFFFDQNDKWTRQYKNLPIHITPNGFSAKLQMIDSVQYVFLPYQILANVAKIGEYSKKLDEGVNSEQRNTIRDANNLPTLESEQAKKIQTEGIVRRNVAEILSHYPNAGQEEQLEILWRYVKEHWNYLNDPFSATDTWRPASETISDYYFVNGKCYTGDCDDFAILMASFAQQVGFRSRLVAAYNPSGGHAYAEYDKYGNGKEWVPLDWFSDEFGGKPFEASEIRYYYDI
jgi:hypothetical protein